MAAKTLAQLRDVVEADLTDASNATWSADEIDRAIRRALFRYSEVRPYEVNASMSAAASREYDISGYVALRVFRVWWPYDSASPEYPPQWQPFALQDNRDDLLLKSDACPAVGDDPLRIYYGIAHTLNGLDGAGASTYIEAHEETLVLGATGFAAMQRTRYVVDTVNPSVATPDNWRVWGSDRMSMFEAALDRIGREFEQELGQWGQWDMTPTGSRTLAVLRDLVETDLRDSGNWQWSTVEIDRGIRQALYRYSEVRPQEVIGTLTAAASREYSLATLTDLVDVQRVWFPYDSTDPSYPPTWVDFELWDDNTNLYLLVEDEPAVGDDPLRVFYTKLHTVNGLDSATASTYFAGDEEVLIAGASAFAALARSRAVAEGGLESALVGQVVRWGDGRMKDFERELERVARKVTRHFDSRVAVNIEI